MGKTLAFICGLVATTTLSYSALGDVHGTAPHWTYTGETGVENWGKIDPSFATCSNGKQQSPVNLKWSKPATDRKIEFAYGTSALRVIDNGHTIQANFDPGSKVKIDGETYELLQMHFHAKSEHTLSGKSFPLEAHFVHKNSEGKLAVVGVMIEEGKQNESFAPLFKNFPKETGKEVKVSSVLWNPGSVIPAKTSHYHYMGSLTTPPCTEGVNWNVLNTPIQASKEQLDLFRSHYTGNFRPVQPLYERKPANY